MMPDREKPKILIQLDPDPHPSVFDSIVAIDSQVDHLLTFGGVEPLDVRDLVHGAMFTRGGKSLQRTAIFIGGTSVHGGEQLLRAVTDSFLGSIRVSVMLDANGANTTAAAAVLSLENHLSLAGQQVAVLAATGSVGRRAVWLAARRGASVLVASRSIDRAQAVCNELRQRDASLDLSPLVTGDPGNHSALPALDGCAGLIAAGAAGVQLVSANQLDRFRQLRVAIDLNAVPPTGIADIQPVDAGRQHEETILYGAIGVGNLKMKIHRRCIRSLFESNDQVLDIDEIFEIGRQQATS